MDKRPKLVIYGAGDIAGQFVCEYKDNGKYADKYDLVGLIDDKKTGDIHDCPILGTSEKFPELISKGIDHVFVSLLLDPVKRLEKFVQLENMKYKFPSLTQFPSGNDRYFPKETKIGKGVLIHESAVFLGYNFDIGDFSVISANAIIERSQIGKGVIINPNTFIAYDSKIGDATIFYPYSGTNPGVTVGARCVIYPHSVVHKDMADGKTKKKYDKEF